jgi:type IV pilus assembly protein PilE
MIKNKLGFTLVELLIVIAILAILATVSFANFTTSRIKAKDISRKSDLQTIAKSLEAYVNDHRAYPSSDASGRIVCKPTGTPSYCAWGEIFSDSTGTIYAAKLPSDPGGYNYYYVTSGTGYNLYTHLENAQDPNLLVTPIAGCGGSGSTCNYKVSSSNL